MSIELHPVAATSQAASTAPAPSPVNRWTRPTPKAGQGSTNQPSVGGKLDSENPY